MYVVLEKNNIIKYHRTSTYIIFVLNACGVISGEFLRVSAYKLNFEF